MHVFSISFSEFFLFHSFLKFDNIIGIKIWLWYFDIKLHLSTIILVGNTFLFIRRRKQELSKNVYSIPEIDNNGFFSSYISTLSLSLSLSLSMFYQTWDEFAQNIWHLFIQHDITFWCKLRYVYSSFVDATLSIKNMVNTELNNNK